MPEGDDVTDRGTTNCPTDSLVWQSGLEPLYLGLHSSALTSLSLPLPHVGGCKIILTFNTSPFRGRRNHPNNKRSWIFTRPLGATNQYFPRCAIDLHHPVLCDWTESNRRHLDFQSNALPTELQPQNYNTSKTILVVPPRFELGPCGPKPHVLPLH